MKERGWQAALESIYPLKINLFRVEDGDLTYIDDAGSPPLRVEHLKVHATNIRNIHSKAHVYPSPVEASGVILGTGRGSVTGHANFLAEPYPGVHALFDLADVPLTPFRPLVARSNLAVKNGVVSTNGELEIAPGVQFLNVRNFEVREVTIDYLHAAATSGKEKQTAETVKQAVKQAGESPTADVRLERLSILESELGFVNRAGLPPTASSSPARRSPRRTSQRPEGRSRRGARDREVHGQRSGGGAGDVPHARPGAPTSTSRSRSATRTCGG